MIGSSSGPQRKDTKRRTFGNRNQFKMIAAVSLLVTLSWCRVAEKGF